ncbi:2OG-Fe(II) oxygenase family protein [Nocardia sp. CDC159]|uniref:2OG-Fe(II) oxygenase family protein n=2 Tax=Nocardiaceae TaxID=85025 RepID=A0A9X2E7N0_9NOCA|nr:MULTISPECIES: 2OG-Fe(II) oxygenase family protein [Nocardia]MCM6774708.1 2OG-Fe(II) oxygenase family protein [Nocardia pulmonis]MCM6787227.1 2OG-Fe(II) oxygenase family protein [Nocardia sp. CDC159]
MVWDRLWTIDVEAHKNSGRCGYSERTVVGATARAIGPRIGDLILFCPRNMHRVVPAAGAGARISVGSFIGLTARGHLAIWS